jgi:hypothetical protein
MFRLIPESQFQGFEPFEEYPVWSEFYDYDEFHEIVGWGIDPDWLTEQLAIHHHGSDHAMYPVLRPQPLPARMRIYIRAEFTTAGGCKLPGYVVDSDAYIVGLFWARRELIFTRGKFALEDNRRACDELRQLANLPEDPILPLQYRTDFLDEQGRPIEGTYDFEERVEAQLGS